MNPLRWTSLFIYSVAVAALTGRAVSAPAVTTIGDIVALDDELAVLHHGQVVRLPSILNLELGDSIRVTGRVDGGGVIDAASWSLLGSKGAIIKGEPLNSAMSACHRGMQRGYVLNTRVAASTPTGVPSSWVTESSIAGVTGASIVGVTGSSIAGVTGSSIAGVTGSSIAGVTGSSIAGVTGSSIAGVTGSSVAGVTGSSVAGSLIPRDR